MSKSNPISREFRIMNTGPKDIKLNWKMFNLDEDENSGNKREFFKVQVIPPPLGSNKTASLNFMPIEPPEAHDGPY